MCISPHLFRSSPRICPTPYYTQGYQLAVVKHVTYQWHAIIRTPCYLPQLTLKAEDFQNISGGTGNKHPEVETPEK